MSSTAHGYLTSAQAASLLGIDVKTLTRWANAGEVNYARLSARSHRLYPEALLRARFKLPDDMTVEERKLLPSEVAQMLGRSKSVLRLLTQNGAIRAFRTIGGARRYRERDVRALLATRFPIGEHSES